MRHKRALGSFLKNETIEKFFGRWKLGPEHCIFPSKRYLSADGWIIQGSINFPMFVFLRRWESSTMNSNYMKLLFWLRGMIVVTKTLRLSNFPNCSMSLSPLVWARSWTHEFRCTLPCHIHTRILKQHNRTLRLRWSTNASSTAIWQYTWDDQGWRFLLHWRLCRFLINSRMWLHPLKKEDCHALGYAVIETIF